MWKVVAMWGMVAVLVGLFVKAIGAVRPIVLNGLAALAVVLVVGAPVSAQQSLVESVKAELVARGVPLAGPCGAFEITKRVAWRLRATGAGLIAKTAGQNNCQLFGTDIVMYPDGRIVDMLIGGGDGDGITGGNGPGWDTGKPPVDPSLYRPAIDPGDGAPVPTSGGPSTPSTPTPVVVQAPALNLEPVLNGIGQNRDQAERMFADLVARLEELRARNDALAAQLKAHDEAPTWAGRVFGNRYTQLVMGAAAAWFTAQQTR